MTDTTTTTRATLDDLAHQAVTNPGALQPADITRLGDFILDHEQHLAFHQRAGNAVRGIVMPGTGDLTRRLAAQAPQPSDAPKLTAGDEPVIQHAADASGDGEQHLDPEA